MSVEKNQKLKNLSVLWPLHTVASTLWLKQKGYSDQLLYRYIQSKWIKHVSRGAVIRQHDQFDWSGAVWGAQQTHSMHVGGKTALEIQGKAHFVKRKETEVFVFLGAKEKLPQWFNLLELEIKIVSIASKFFPPTIGIIQQCYGDFSLNISNPARAMMEYIFLLDKYHSYEEAYFLMEGLSTLDPTLFQEALENCTSIKVKRLTLCLAKKVGVNWYKDIEIQEINLGAGPRHYLSKGAYDSEYMITYPKVWDKDDNVQF